MGEGRVTLGIGNGWDKVWVKEEWY